jgi:hypothetical protein
MKRCCNFEAFTVKQIKKEIVFWETRGGRDAKKVEVLSIGQDPDADMYTYDDVITAEEWYESFNATVIIDGKEHVMEYEISLADGSICSSQECGYNNDINYSNKK